MKSNELSMRINELSLLNFRCFDNHSVSLNPNFNIFIGDNAAGKTAILEALAIGIGAFLIGFGGISVRNIRKEDVRECLFKKGETVTAEFQYPLEIKCEGIVNDRKCDWYLQKRHIKGQTDRRGLWDLRYHSEFSAQQIRNGEDVVLPVIAYYSTQRLWLSKKETFSPKKPGSRLNGYKNCLTASSDVRIFKDWWKQHELITIQKKKNSSQLNAVRKALIGAIPEVNEIIFDFEYNDLIILFSNGEISSFFSLSDGYRSTLAMIADIASRASLLNPFLNDKVLTETPGIVLIDELDLHLHPRWQRQIVNSLRSVFPKIQFITTTHAPQILVGAQKGEIRILSKDEENRIMVEECDIPPGLRVDQVLTGKWFELQSTLDDDTLKMLDEHRVLLRKVHHLSEQEKDRKDRIEKELRKRLGSYAETPLEQMAVSIIAEITDSNHPLSSEDRKKIREHVLDKIRKKIG